MSFARRTLREAALLAGLSAFLGLVVNAPLVVRWARGEFAGGFTGAKSYPGIVRISMAEAEDLFASGRGLFVDARPAAEFRKGHVPGARNLPFETADETALAALKAALPPGRPVVVYCQGEDCLSSLGLARLLAARGLEEVRVLPGGWAEWGTAGLPSETGR